MTVKNLYSLLKRFSYYLLLTIRSFFFLLAKLSFILIILAIGLYAFCINDQGLDMMAAFSFMKVFRDAYISLAVIFLFIWASATWNVTRVLLGAANLKRLVESQVDPSTVLPEGQELEGNLIIATIDPNYKKIIETLIKWVPRLLVLIPYIIFIVAYVKENGSANLFNVIVISLLALVHFIAVIARRSVAARLSRSRPTMKAQKRSFDWTEEKKVWHAVKKTKVIQNSIVTGLATIVVFIYAVNAAFSLPTDPGKPGLIILSALIVYTAIGFIINLYANKLRVPIFLLLVFFAIFFASGKNDNHNTQTLNTPDDRKMLATRKPDSVYCSEWIDHKISSGSYDTSKLNTIFLIAAEGGGIRSCYWTYSVLQKLQNLQPSFYDHTFAATGASGGSMGLGFYYNFIYHNKEKYTNNRFFLRAEDSARLDAICSGDYLSRVTYAFLYPDLIQRFLPWPIESWDRGKHLANSFDDGFSVMIIPHKDDHLLSHNYQEMWAGPGMYDHPAVLFNSTYAERGSKAIYSPYVLSQKNYADVLDILSVTKRSVPMKEGMVSSARFPVLTAPGLMYYDSTHDNNKVPKKLGHLFDGGGFENTGIQTAQQTAVMLKKELSKKELSGKFRIVIIYIGYGTGSMAPDKNTSIDSVAYHKPFENVYELGSVLGGANTIFRWIYTAHGLAIQMDPEMNVLEFGLRSKFDSTEHKLPLGLYMSRTSKYIMQKEILDSGARTFLKRAIREFNRSF